MKANEKYQVAKAANATSGVGTVNVIKIEF